MMTNEMSIIKRWKIFLNERFPIIPNIIITTGLVSTSFGLYKSPMNRFTYLYACIVFFLFLGQLRFMDELKDYQKDLIAHPKRPLPRGLITTSEMRLMIFVVQGILFLLALSSFVFFTPFSGLCLLIGIVWLFLMYKEFFIGKSLSKFPFIYAITHQVIILPMGMFVMSAINQTNEFNSLIFALSALLLCTFFTYEISRKLDPNAIPLLGTYLVVSGKSKTILAITFLTAIGLFLSSYLNLGLWLTIPLIIVYLSHSLLYLAPKKFKITEAFVTIYLLYIIWLLPLKNLF